MKIQPHHQTTGVESASPSQLANGGWTSIGTPGTWPAISNDGHGEGQRDPEAPPHVRFHLLRHRRIGHGGGVVVMRAPRRK